MINTYDALGRVIHQEQRNGNDVIAETINDYFYDQAVDVGPHVQPTHMLGRLALATSPTGSEAFSYDTFGRINARVFTDKQGELYVEKHAFHGDGSPRTLDFLLPDAAFAPEQVTYQYDSAGRAKLTTYTKNGSTQKLFEAQAIDPFGRVRQARYGATTYTASYADLGRRLMNQAALSSPSGSRSISYQGYDPVGRERSRSEAKLTSGVSTEATTNWAYDALGRLTSAIQTRGTTTVFNQQFTYDPLGNLVSLSDTPGTGASTSTTLTYLGTDRDRICRIRHGSDTGTTCNVTYDEVGSIVVQPTPTGQRQYSYFADGSVRTITDTLGSAAQFRYDAFGQVQELDVTSSVSPDTRRDRRYGGLLAWRDVTTGGTATSILSRKVPSPDGSVATRRGAGGPWIFEFGEGRGNRFFVDQDGAFVQDVDYQPYGTATSTGAQPGSPQYSTEQWNGGDLLAAFGISHLGARLYDPAIGRFLSRDPLLIPRTAATTNPYAFAINDPVNYSDPSGLDHECDPDRDGAPCVNEKGEKGETTTDDDGSAAGGWRPIGGLDFDVPGETPVDPGYLAGGYKVPVVAGYAAAGQLFPEAIAGAAGAAGAEAAGTAAAGGAAVGGAVVGGIVVAAAVVIAAGVVTVALAPSGVGYPRCGDYNAHCWNDYIRRAKDEQDKSYRRTNINLDTGTIIAVSQLKDLSLSTSVMAYLSGKRLLLTRAAYDEFMAGPYLVAGPLEKGRAALFLMSVNIIANSPSPLVMGLPSSKSQLHKMSINDRIIFGTGYQLGITTSTDDGTAVRWAATKGIHLNVFEHAPARYISR
jgi:RHS repeat-associated protein